jgi:7-carboxy-7-deazaguanine synthase
VTQDATLRISEIFFSLQGETSRVGLPTVFVRLTGCPLRCRWCDTAYAFTGGSTRSLSEILQDVLAFPCRRVTVTGGEPLAQANCQLLLTRLADAGCDVALETSGALDIGGVDCRVARIVDLKPPGSGEEKRNRLANLALLTPRDEIKFVIGDRRDYEWSRQQIADHGLGKRCPVLFSPVAGEIEPAELAGWVLTDGLDVRLQLQLHKILWGNAPGH